MDRSRQDKIHTPRYVSSVRISKLNPSAASLCAREENNYVIALHTAKAMNFCTVLKKRSTLSFTVTVTNIPGPTTNVHKILRVKKEQTRSHLQVVSLLVN